jgi:hypothetical protein
MKEQLSSPRPEVDLNPHSDLPATGVISTEIFPVPAGERQGVSPPSSRAPEPAPLPFGVYLGQPAPSETPNP